jgi:pyruvate dehydrogenase E2 component (dihydrolipoamide acetyltransferase)
MVTPLILPSFSLGMKEGTILQWFKKEKDRVQKGEPVVKVFGEKMEVDLDSPEDGNLLKILYGEKAEVPVSTVIGLIGQIGEDISSYLAQLGKGAPPVGTVNIPAERQQATAVQAIIKPSVIAGTQVEPLITQGVMEQPGRVRASPAAKRIAREKDLDIKGVTGTGPGGRVVAKDVSSFVGSTVATAFPKLEAGVTTGMKDVRKVKQVAPMTPTRKVIAKRMSQSARTAPHITVIMETDMSEVVKLRERLLPEVEKRAGTKLSYNDIIVKAVAKALEEFPAVNSSLIDENNIKIFDEINVGVAIAAKEGLIVPVIRNANKLSIAEISANLNRLVNKANQGKLTPDEMSGGTFTVTSLGMYGVDLFMPIINPPESGILAVGRIAKKPVVDDKGQITVKPMAFLALAVDHRVIDGAPGAEFLQRLKEILEYPIALNY